MSSTPSFTSLGVPPSLAAALTKAGITDPFPIQAATLPDTLAGRDVLGRGRTGSGKTVAFAVPLVVAVAASPVPAAPGRPQALVLLPTRELAAQVAATIRVLADAAGLEVVTIFGGVPQRPQVRALERGAAIAVACPGRLEDLVKQGHCNLGDVAVTVLDEADHMADLGFLPTVRRLLDATPGSGQRLLFSATLDDGIGTLARRYLTNPATHSVDSAESPVGPMTHHVLTVAADDKAAVVRELAGGAGRTVLFMRTKHHAKRLARQLNAAGVGAVELHGNLSQGARQRNLAAFSSGTSPVLVATDIAARGIHVDDIALVVHVDPPADHKAYLHRSGRTARAGAAGTVVTIAVNGARAEVDALTRRAKIDPTVTAVSPGHAMLATLTQQGAPARPSAAGPAPIAGAPAGAWFAP